MVTQTSQQTETKLAADVSKAQAQLEKLREAAAEAEAEAGRWRTTFAREPTAQAHTNAAVSKQKAANALAAADQFERETLAPLEAKQRAEADAAERALLSEQLDWRHAEELQARMEQAVRDCRAELDATTRELNEFLTLRRDLGARANSLGVQVAPSKFAHVVDQVNERLEKTATLGYVHTGSPGTMKLEISLPAYVHGALL